MACGPDKRDAELNRLYSDGREYLRVTRLELEKTNNAIAAAIVIENSLPRLEELVERKKALEKQFPEVRDAEHREQLHSKFAEFRNLRADLQAFMAFGQGLLEKYQKTERFVAAVRKGVALMSYF